MPYAPQSAADVRHRLTEQMRAAGLAPVVVDDALLVVSELVGNALRHARPRPDGSILVGWRLGGRGLTIEVTDGGSPSAPEVRTAQAWATSGRGLAIVQALTSTWGVRPGAPGTTVWAELPTQGT